MACKTCNIPQPRANMMQVSGNSGQPSHQLPPPGQFEPQSAPRQPAFQPMPMNYLAQQSQQPQNMLGGSGGYGGQGYGGQGYQPTNQYQQQYQQNPQDLMQQLSQLQQFQNPGGQGTINYQAPGANNSTWQNFKEGVRNFTVGEPGQALQFPNYTPLQQGVLNRLLLQGSQNSDFSGIENNARRNFHTQTVPSIAERFTAMGSGNRGSSAFAGQLGAAGSELESQLGALRGQYGLQQLQQGLRPQYENAYIPRSGGLLQALPNIAATYFGAGR